MGVLLRTLWISGLRLRAAPTGGRGHSCGNTPAVRTGVRASGLRLQCRAAKLSGDSGIGENGADVRLRLLERGASGLLLRLRSGPERCFMKRSQGLCITLHKVGQGALKLAQLQLLWLPGETQAAYTITAFWSGKTGQRGARLLQEPSSLSCAE